jgi:hypothetical protein
VIVECDLDLGAHVTLLTALLSTVPLPKLRRWTMWALRVADEGVVEAWLRAARIESEGAVRSVAWRGVVLYAAVNGISSSPFVCTSICHAPLQSSSRRHDVPSQSWCAEPQAFEGTPWSASNDDLLHTPRPPRCAGA